MEVRLHPLLSDRMFRLSAKEKCSKCPGACPDLRARLFFLLIMNIIDQEIHVSRRRQTGALITNLSLIHIFACM